jgi:hypothetical protein
MRALLIVATLRALRPIAATHARMVRMNIHPLRRIVCSSLLLLCVAVPSAQAFPAGNIGVVRVGTGAAPLTSDATAVFVDIYQPDGTPVTTITLPTAGAFSRLTLSGTDTTEGMATNSPDGLFFSIGGYAAALGTASVSTSNSTSISRVLALINGAGAINTTTRPNDVANGGAIRSAFTPNDGQNLWSASSTSGIRMTTLGSNASFTNFGIVSDMRFATVFGGQLYASTGDGRIGSIGSGLPFGNNPGPNFTALQGLPTASPGQFVLLDTDAGVAGLDTLYSADNAGNTVNKYYKNQLSGNWTLAGSMALASAHGITATASGGTVTIYATSPTVVAKATDTSALASAPNGSFTTIVTAASNTAFRGIAAAPLDSPSFQISALSNNFGSRPIPDGATGAFAFTVSNPGTGALHVSAVSIAGNNASDFAITGGSCGPAPFTVAVSGSCTIEVSFDPSALGQRDAQINFTDNAVGAHLASLVGIGTDRVISLSTSTLDFGSQRIQSGATSSSSVTITNTGTAPMTISSVGISGANAALFSAPGGTCALTPRVIPAGSSCTVTTTYDPTSVGANAATITVASNASSGGNTIDLSGSGIESVFDASPVTVTFGDQPINFGPTASQGVLITNNGTASLNVSSAVITGVNAADFALAAGTCGPVPIVVAPSGSCSVLVTFNPTVDGSRTAAISFVDDTTAGAHSVPLSGTGTPSAPTPGADVLTGTSRGDVMNGLAGNDIIRGLGGDDSLRGGAGTDQLYGGEGDDDLNGGADKDKLYGGAGNDALNAADRKPGDIVDCGAGKKDVATVNEGDKVKGCERVIVKK